MITTVMTILCWCWWWWWWWLAAVAVVFIVDCCDRRLLSAYPAHDRDRQQHRARPPTGRRCSTPCTAAEGWRGEQDLPQRPRPSSAIVPHTLRDRHCRHRRRHWPRRRHHGQRRQGVRQPVSHADPCTARDDHRVCGHRGPPGGTMGATHAAGVRAAPAQTRRRNRLPDGGLLRLSTAAARAATSRPRRRGGGGSTNRVSRHLAEAGARVRRALSQAPTPARPA